jgi:hypothetical protein
MHERFNMLRVKEQLINNGITDTVRVRQQGANCGNVKVHLYASTLSVLVWL